MAQPLTHSLATGRGVRTLVFALPCVSVRNQWSSSVPLSAMVTSCELDLQPQQQRHLHDYNAATEAAVKEHAVLGMILPECEC